MGEFGNAIKYLYSQFILRDVLSFITPGAILVFSALFLLCPEKIPHLISIHWLLYIPLFGVLYLVGFAVQCLGELFKIISFSPPDKYRWSREQRWNIFGTHWTRDKDTVWWNDYYKMIEEFWRLTGSDVEAHQRRERLIVLKQVCGNGFLSITIAGIFLGTSFCSLSWVKILIPSLVAFLLLGSLFWGQRVHVLRQYSREKIIIESRTENGKKRGV
ncbi:MAG TPA: hypothetical protein G4O20_08395 [Dehalococcoidia bacterium]|nr:hypothetical protein [Dehalococcoidia bacterium]